MARILPSGYQGEKVHFIKETWRSRYQRFVKKVRNNGLFEAWKEDFSITIENDSIQDGYLRGQDPARRPAVKIPEKTQIHPARILQLEGLKHRAKPEPEVPAFESDLRLENYPLLEIAKLCVDLEEVLIKDRTFFTPERVAEIRELITILAKLLPFKYYPKSNIEKKLFLKLFLGTVNLGQKLGGEIYKLDQRMQQAIFKGFLGNTKLSPESSHKPFVVPKDVQPEIEDQSGQQFSNAAD